MSDRLKQTKVRRLVGPLAAVWLIVGTSFPVSGAEWFALPGEQEIEQPEHDDMSDLGCRLNESGVTLLDRGKPKFFPFRRLMVSVQQARSDGPLSDVDELRTSLTVTVATCAPSRFETRFCIAYFGRHAPGQVSETTWRLVDEILNEFRARGSAIVRDRPCEDCDQDIDNEVNCGD